MKKCFTIFLIASISIAAIQINDTLYQPTFIEPSVQRSGDAIKGYEYLTTGNYLKSGIPFSLFTIGTIKDSNNFLNRTGINKNIGYDFTAVKAPNNEIVVAPNCLQCHAQIFDNKLVIGLGNSLSDFTVNRESTAIMAEKLLKNLTGIHAKKYEAAKNFITAIKTISPALITSTKGVNLADVLAAVLVAHRNPQTLQWSDKPLMELPTEKIPSDVPAWWLLKKKNAMFYNGFGRGDFSKFLMASNLLTVSDTAEATEVDSHFNDVLAYIQSINPPKYPKTINEKLADKGEKIFIANCSKCHGTYGATETYPNLLIPQQIIQTDSALYAANYSSPQFVEWFNKSWFTTGSHPAKLVPYKGYIAPPLDGIWITAPYLHNGSIPNLEALLNSKLRPTYWQRNFNQQSYNYDVPGWNFNPLTTATTSDVYNTTLKGFTNTGHYFGDELTNKQRKALIEYLKKL